MEATMDVRIHITEEEKALVLRTIKLLGEIKGTLQDYRDNGHYEFIDSTIYPPEIYALETAIVEMKRPENGE